MISFARNMQLVCASAAGACRTKKEFPTPLQSYRANLALQLLHAGHNFAPTLNFQAPYRYSRQVQFLQRFMLLVFNRAAGQNGADARHGQDGRVGRDVAFAQKFALAIQSGGLQRRWLQLMQLDVPPAAKAASFAPAPSGRAAQICLQQMLNHAPVQHFLIPAGALAASASRRAALDDPNRESALHPFLHPLQLTTLPYLPPQSGNLTAGLLRGLTAYLDSSQFASKPFFQRFKPLVFLARPQAASRKIKSQIAPCGRSHTSNLQRKSRTVAVVPNNSGARHGQNGRDGRNVAAASLSSRTRAQKLARGSGSALQLRGLPLTQSKYDVPQDEKAESFAPKPSGRVDQIRLSQAHRHTLIQRMPAGAPASGANRLMTQDDPIRLSAQRTFLLPLCLARGKLSGLIASSGRTTALHPSGNNPNRTFPSAQGIQLTALPYLHRQSGNLVVRLLRGMSAYLASAQFASKVFLREINRTGAVEPNRFGARHGQDGRDGRDMAAALWPPLPRALTQVQKFTRGLGAALRPSALQQRGLQSMQTKRDGYPAAKTESIAPSPSASRQTKPGNPNRESAQRAFVLPLQLTTLPHPQNGNPPASLLRDMSAYSASSQFASKPLFLQPYSVPAGALRTLREVPALMQTRLQQQLSRQVEQRLQQMARDNEGKVQTQVVQQIVHGGETREQIRKLMDESLLSPNMLHSLTERLFTALEKRSAVERYRKGIA